MSTRLTMFLLCFLASEAAPAQGTADDSLRTALLRLAVRDAEIDAGRTDLWHRIVPRVEMSAGFSASHLLFAEAPAGTAFILPNDAYRFSVGVSLSGILDASAHEKALVLLERARTELLLYAAVRAAARTLDAVRSATADSIRSIEDEELRLRAELARYQGLLFEQGKAGFEELVRARLALLHARASAFRNERAGVNGREEP